jgi:hypothetical protein
MFINVRDLRKWQVGVLSTALLMFMPTATANGSTDLTFSSDGYFFLDQLTTGADYELFTDVGSQSDGLILAGDREGDLVIAKVNNAGELVNSFGPNGNGLNIFSSPFKAAKKLIVLSDGSFAVLANYGSDDSVLLKFTSNGILDDSFNSNGIWIIDESTDSWDAHWPVDIDVSADGSVIYVATSNATTASPGQYVYGLISFNLIGNRDASVENIVLGHGIGGEVRALEISDTNEIYLVGIDNSTPTNGRVIKLRSDGTYDPDFVPGPTFGRMSVSFQGEQFPLTTYDVEVTDIKTDSSGTIYLTGIANPPYASPANETEFFVQKMSGSGVFASSNTFYEDDRFIIGHKPTIVIQNDGKFIVAVNYFNIVDSVYNSKLIRFNSDSNFDSSFGTSGEFIYPSDYYISSLFIQSNQKLIGAGGFGSILANNGYLVSKNITSPVPNPPTIGIANALGANSASITFSAPTPNGGSTITSYTVTSSPGGFTGTLSGATAGTITVTGLLASTAYTFTVTATNSEGTSGASAASNSITTSAASGGTGGGGTGADELRRQQEAAAAAKRKQDQELREILSLVPSIAGLAQGVAGLGNSLLLPKKCVKGKLVKNVKAGAKCPKGYKARK